MSRNYLQINMPNSDYVKQNKKIESQTKSIIKTVIERCKKERDSNSLQVPLDDYVERVSYYTGFPKTYICKLIDDDDKPVNKNVKCSLDPALILYCMNDFYLKEKTPTYKDVHRKVVNTITEYSDFRYQMAQLGYGYRKMVNGYLLMEDPKLTFERFHYINTIKKYRSKMRNIYYIDEILMDFKLNFEKSKILHHSSKTDLTLFHVISKLGYVNGLFCYNPSAEEFIKWVVDLLIPNLQPSSVVVMKHTPLHSMRADTPISRYNSKNDMLLWLKHNNIPCNSKMHKAELYELIDKCFSKTENYTLDTILKAYGHDVLRLPKNYHDLLSPTTLLWKEVKSIMQNKTPKTHDLPSLRQKVNETIASLPLYKWVEFQNVVVNKEDEIFAIDTTTERSLDYYKIDISEPYCSHEYDSFDDSD